MLGDVNGDSEESCPEAMARVRIRCSVMCTGWIRLRLELGSGSYVMARVRLRFRVIGRHGLILMLLVWGQVHGPGIMFVLGVGKVYGEGHG